MTDYVRTATGNWSDTTKWNPSTGYPVSGTDTAVLCSDQVVTLDVDVSVGAITIGMTPAGTTRMAQLILGTGRTLTMLGTMKVGNGVDKAGRLTFGESSTLAMGIYNVELNNCILDSVATPTTWAKVTGSGSINYGTAFTTRAYQQIEPRYVSFQNTGNVYFNAGGNNSGGATILNKIDVRKCTFAGQARLFFGLGGYTTDHIYEDVDFRELTGTDPVMTVAGIGTAPTVQPRFTHCTWVQTVRKQVRINSPLGFLVENCAWSEIWWSMSAGNIRVSKCFWSVPTGGTAGGNVFQFADIDGQSMDSCFGHHAEYNSHCVGGSSATGAFTFTASNTIFETVYNDEGDNVICINSKLTTCYGNILIGSGSLYSCVGGATAGGGMVLKKSTCVMDLDIPYPALYLSENGEYIGSIGIRDCLVQGNVTMTDAISKNTTPPDQTIAYSDYNVFNSCTNRYRNATVTAGLTHDKASIPPNFFDPTRRLATWGKARGGTGTTADTITKLQTMNGYDATTKCQIAANASGFEVLDLVSWVRAGHRPTNKGLRLAGDPALGGGDIGAMPVYAPTRRTLTGRLKECSIYGNR